MFRECSKMGCRQEAIARVGLDPSAQLVIVDDAIDTPGGAALLCQAHLDRLTAPRGWWVDDRRTKKLSLFSAAEHGKPAAKRRRKARKDDGPSSGDVTLQPVDDPVIVEPVAQDAEVAEEVAQDAEVETDARNDPPRPGPSPLLNARTPLLARAFQSAEPSGPRGSGLSVLFGGISAAS